MPETLACAPTWKSGSGDDTRVVDLSGW